MKRKQSISTKAVVGEAYRLIRSTARPIKPVLRRLGVYHPHSSTAKRFRSADYWENRYSTGGNSGAGSYSELGQYKAGVINQFVRVNSVHTAIDFGAGDGAQLALLQIPRYIGLDVSPTTIRRLEGIFGSDATKEFRLYAPGIVTRDRLGADLALSLDVIFHLVEDAVFEQYMTDLFAAAERYVIIYSSNSTDESTALHVRHRRFTDYVAANCRDWKLDRMLENPHKPKSFADFYFYVRS